MDVYVQEKRVYIMLVDDEFRIAVPTNGRMGLFGGCIYMYIGKLLTTTFPPPKKKQNCIDTQSWKKACIRLSFVIVTGVSPDFGPIIIVHWTGGAGGKFDGPWPSLLGGGLPCSLRLNEDGRRKNKAMAITIHMVMIISIVLPPPNRPPAPSWFGSSWTHSLSVQ